MTPRQPRYHRFRTHSVVVYTWDTRFGSVWKAWHFVVIHENVSRTLQLRRILSKSSMWKCRTSYSNISKKFLSKKCLLAVDAATMCRVESTLISWRRQYHWQAGGPFHYSLIVELKFDESIDNDFAHNRNLRSDCNNSLHMPQSWVVMACAKNIQQNISKMTAQK